MRTALEGSRGFTLGAGRLSLTPSVEVGVGGGLAFSDTVTGLSLDLRMRTLAVQLGGRVPERGLSLSFEWDATPSSPLGLTAQSARVARPEVQPGDGSGVGQHTDAAW